VSQQPQLGSGKRGPQDLDTAIAGGSLGTVIATLSTTLLPDSWYKIVLVTTAPALAVGISTGWAWVRRRGTRRINEKEAETALSVAEATLLKIIEDEASTTEQVEKAKVELAELRQLDIDTRIEYAKARLRKRYDEE